jgi:Na+/melibiose symporter-like transporter
LLPRSQLLAVSVYWLGINALFGGYEIFGQQRVKEIVGDVGRGRSIGAVELTAALVAIIVQPTIGTISDYTQTRWGRRKPFILIGAALDVVFVVGIASSHTLVSLTAFLVLLMFSANFAQGPLQGYVPDLVPERQVNIASALVGFMRLGGLVLGAAIVSTGAFTQEYELPLIFLGFFEFALAVVTVIFVREGPVAKPRHGRSWLSIATEAWGLDALRERGFVFMTLTRLMFLAVPAAFVNFAYWYMQDSMGLAGVELTLWTVIGLGTIGSGAAIGSLASERATRTFGRKKVAWFGGVLMGIGILFIAFGPTPPAVMPGLILLGLGSGAYIAVDWAIMTSTIPRISSGRYMGLANIANSISGPVATIFGGIVLDAASDALGLGAGPRAAVLTGLIFLAIGSLTIIPVRPRVEAPGDVQLAAAPAPS